MECFRDILLNFDIYFIYTLQLGYFRCKSSKESYVVIVILINLLNSFNFDNALIKKLKDFYFYIISIYPYLYM